MREELQAAQKLAGAIVDADGEKATAYQDALSKGLAATEPLVEMLNAMRLGDKDKINERFGELADVLRTLEACDRMDAAIENAKNGVELKDVLDVIETILAVGIRVAALL